jgi:hypothetical protein
VSVQFIRAKVIFRDKTASLAGAGVAEVAAAMEVLGVMVG